MALATEKMVEDALEYLARNAEVAAGAKAQRIRAEYKRKRVKARLMLDSNEKAATMREAWAETQQAYVDACEDELEAIEAEEAHRNRRNAAEMVIETWRTLQANHRAGNSFR